MKISELLSENDNGNKVAIASTERFRKEATKLLDADMRSKLEKWLMRKQANPLQLAGNDDRAGRHEFKPWNHVHMTFGNSICVHYLALPNLIVLGSVTDHRPLDGASLEGHRLVAYLHGLNIDALTPLPSEEEKSLELSPEMKTLAKELIYELASDAQERDNLETFASTDDVAAVREWFQVSNLPLDSSSVKFYAQMARQAVAAIPAHTIK